MKTKIIFILIILFCIGFLSKKEENKKSNIIDHLKSNECIKNKKISHDIDNISLCDNVYSVSRMYPDSHIIDQKMNNDGEIGFRDGSILIGKDMRFENDNVDYYFFGDKDGNLIQLNRTKKYYDVIPKISNIKQQLIEKYGLPNIEINKHVVLLNYQLCWGDCYIKITEFGKLALCKNDGQCLMFIISNKNGEYSSLLQLIDNIRRKEYANNYDIEMYIIKQEKKITRDSISKTL